MIDFEQRRSGLLRRMVRRAAEIVPMSWIRPRLVVRVDREVFRLSGGRTTLSALVSGLPIIMLTTTGARTGQARAVPVLGLAADDRLVLIASNFGKPSNPGWYYNLRAHSHAVVTWNGAAREMQARELQGDERQRYVDLGIKAYPWWEPYHHRAAPRQIPVIMLEQVHRNEG
jgi:deazaflavin-dependent oxidoreductase (nitroreductase family)